MDEFSLETKLEIAKLGAKQNVFGWAYVMSEDGQTQVFDKSGEYIDLEDIEHLEDGAYEFVKNVRVGSDFHIRKGVSTMIESMVFTPEKIEKMGLPSSFPIGWWVGFHVSDPDTWASVEKSSYLMFSVHGKALKQEIEVDE